MSYENLPTPKSIPKEFLRRRLHSLAGLFFVLFLFEHMLTNSEAALLVGKDGSGFIAMVNLIHSIPYLPLVEIFLLAVPIAIHVYLGIIYLYEAKTNSWPTDGSKPALPSFARNHAFTWQRITSLVLVIGLLAHVINMRFMHHPKQVGSSYAVEVEADRGLVSLAPRLQTQLITPRSKEHLLQPKVEKKDPSLPPTIQAEQCYEIQNENEQIEFIETTSPTKDQWIAVAPDFGTAALLLVRENFRTLWICILYTIFVLAASFHAANGLWTFAICWGIALNEQSRKIVRLISTGLGFMLASGGLACIWLTYWVNLRN